MEFRYRAGEEKERVSPSLEPMVDSSLSSPSSYSYFTLQAILAGMDISSLTNSSTNMSRESLLEEIRRERLREEMLVQEIARKRKLEEDIVRELENEKQIPVNKLDASFGYRFETSPFDDQRTKNLLSPETSRMSLDRRFPACKLQGVKRKATSNLTVPVKKEWICSLCRVTATSKDCLNVHINGKKHKAKEAQLIKNKTRPYEKSKQVSTFWKDENKSLEEEDITTNKLADEGIFENSPEKDKCALVSIPTNKASKESKNQQYNKNDTNAWCMTCIVEGQLEANTSENAEVIKEITEEKTIVEVNEGQDNVKACKENLMKYD